MTLAWLIFSDLDETLLDRETYSFEPARPALEEVRRRGIPLILCTSKSAAETLVLQRQLGIEGPFVVEDGGGVYVPRDLARDLAERSEERGDHVLVALAPRRERVLEGYRRLLELAGGGLRGFHEMSVEEIAHRTALSIEQARRAAQREFDEPFAVLSREEEIGPRLETWAAAMGLRVRRGGRFWHLHGDTDKGRAVRLVTTLYRRRLAEVRTVGLGDSALDLPMLQAVDVPIAVARGDGTHDASLVNGVPHARREPRSGPEGWNRAVLDLLSGR